jgi:hypothetical protein
MATVTSYGTRADVGNKGSRVSRFLEIERVMARGAINERRGAANDQRMVTEGAWTARTPSGSGPSRRGSAGSCDKRNWL